MGPFTHAIILEYQKGPLADYVPYTPMTRGILKKLADLKPKTLAIMHGSSFTGNREQALLDLATVFREAFGG
jgi:hypothetical protein